MAQETEFSRVSRGLGPAMTESHKTTASTQFEVLICRRVLQIPCAQCGDYTSIRSAVNACQSQAALAKAH
eukprot:5656959-Amphidinium_carterae.1